MQTSVAGGGPSSSRTQVSTATGLRSRLERVSTEESDFRVESTPAVTVEVVVTGWRVTVASVWSVFSPLLVFVVPPARVTFMSSSPARFEVTSARNVLPPNTVLSTLKSAIRRLPHGMVRG